MKKIYYLLPALIILDIVTWLVASFSLQFWLLGVSDILFFIITPAVTVALVIIAVVDRLKISRNLKIILNIIATALAIFVALYMFNYVANLIGPA